MSNVTLNPNERGSLVILSNGNLSVSITGRTSAAVKSTKYVTSGKWYFEVTINKENEVFNRSTLSIGIANSDFKVTDSGNGRENVAYFHGVGSIHINTIRTVYGETCRSGDVIGVAFNIDAKTIRISRNGLWYTDVTIPTWTNYNPIIIQDASSGTETATINFGATKFKYPIPSGYSAYNMNYLFIIKKNEYLFSILDTHYDTINKKYNHLGNLIDIKLPENEKYMENDIKKFIKEIKILDETFKPIEKFDKFNMLIKKK